MAMIKPGFRGYAQIDSPDLTKLKIRFNTCSLNAEQQIEAPDMVMGDETHNAWAFGKIEVAGSINGPVTESTGEFIDYLEANYEDGVTINVKYFDGFTRAFAGCRLNQFTFNVTAGEVVNYTLDIMGTKLLDVDPVDMTGFTKGEKLVTWDKSSFRILQNSGSPVLKRDDDADWNSVYETLDYMDGLQAFQFTASNNLQRQFVLGQSDLFGDLVEGMKNVEGSITSYAGDGGIQSSRDPGKGANFWDEYDGDYAYPIRFDIGANFRVYAAVRFARGTAESQIGPIVTTINFKGVTTHGKGRVEFVL
jgi:hypothetical protein